MKKEELELLAYKYALHNAKKYGQAKLQSVVSHAIGEKPEIKKEMKAFVEIAKEIVNRVNAMGKEEVEKEISRFTFEEKEEREEKALILPNAEEGEVTTRFAPEPAGYLHLGHAKAAWLSRACADTYKGKMILRFDDTNPEKCSKEYVEKIKEDLKWLGITWENESYTSDSLPEMYESIKELIQKGKAYVCTCGKEDIARLRKEKKPCPCRALSPEEHLDRFHWLLREGNAIVRFKGNMAHENTTLRDPTLFRVNEIAHFRQGSKFRLWPTYDFATVFMDHKEGITHVLRSKEYELRDELYKELCKALGYEAPELITFARLNIQGHKVGKRYIKPLIEEGVVQGWCDVRLLTLCALRKRGIKAEAIKRFVLSFGLGKAESTPTIEKLLAENRKLLDPISPHYFVVVEPVEFQLIGDYPEKITLPLHPKKSLGYRTLRINGRIYLSREDAESIGEGERIRLKDFATVEREGSCLRIVEGEMPKRKVQWVSEGLKIKMLYPEELYRGEEVNPNSLREKEGLAEQDLVNLKPGQTAQFERLGFFTCLEPLLFVKSC